jgi:DNA polymerase-3 subunit delta
MEGAEVCEYALPANRDLPRWIIERASRAGGDFSAAAAQELAAGGVDSPRALQSEIEKLLAYVNWARTVTAEDVRRMVPSAATADIFRLVDSLGERNARRAMAQLHHLLRSGDRDAMGVFGMVVRQYRLLLQAKEILEQGGTAAEVKSRLGLPGFVAEKISVQSRHYGLGALERIYRRLLSMDTAMKSGSDIQVVLDVMVAGLTA